MPTPAQLEALALGERTGGIDAKACANTVMSGSTMKMLRKAMVIAMIERCAHAASALTSIL